MPTDIDGFSGISDEDFERALESENLNPLFALQSNSAAFFEAFILLQTESLNFVVDEIASKKEFLAQFSEGLSSLSVEKIDNVINHLGQAGSFSQNKIQIMVSAIQTKSIKTGKAAIGIIEYHQIKSGLGIGILFGILAAVLEGGDGTNTLSGSDTLAAVRTETVTAVSPIIGIPKPKGTVAKEASVPEGNVPALVASVPFVDNPPMGDGGKSAAILAPQQEPNAPFFDFLAEDAVHAVEFPVSDSAGVSTNSSPTGTEFAVKPAVSGVASFVKANSEGGASLSPNRLSSIAMKFNAIPGEERVPLFADLTDQEISNLLLIKEVLEEGGKVVISMFQSMGARSGYGTNIDGISGPETLAHALVTILVCNKDFEKLCESMNYYEEITEDPTQWDPLAVYLQKIYGSHINLPKTIKTRAELESTLVMVIKFATTTNDERVPYFAFDQALITELKLILAEKGVGNIAVEASEIQTTAPEAPIVPSLVMETVGVSVTAAQALVLSGIVSQIQEPMPYELPAIDTTPAITPAETVPAVAVVEEAVVPATVETVADVIPEVVATIDVISQMQQLTNGQAYVVNPDGSLNMERGALDVMVNGSSNFNTSVNLEPGSQVIIRVEQGGTVYFVGYDIIALPNGGVDIDTATQEVIHQE